MSADVFTALMTGLVGMITVFVILLLVVASGRFLIGLSNRFAPEIPTSFSKAVPPDGIAPEVIVAITSAVHALSKGQAKVEKIEQNKK